MEQKHEIRRKKAASNWGGCLFWVGFLVLSVTGFVVGSRYYPNLNLSTGQVRFLFVLYYFFALGLYIFYDGFRTYREFRVLAVTPRSPIRGLAMGFVEISGLAKPADQLPCPSPISRTPCLCYRVNIEEAALDARGGHMWQGFHLDFHGWRFYLEDGTGKVLVDGSSGAREDLPVTCQCEIKMLPSGSPEVRAGSPNEIALAGYVSKGWWSPGQDLRLQPGQLYRLTERCLLPEHRYSVAGTCVENPAPRDELDRNMIVKGDTEGTFEISWHAEKGLRSDVLVKGQHAIYGGAAISVASVACMLALLRWSDISAVVLAATLGFGLAALFLFTGLKRLRQYRGLAASSTAGDDPRQAKLKTDTRNEAILFLTIGSAWLCFCLAIALAKVVGMHASPQARSTQALIPGIVAAVHDDALPADGGRETDVPGSRKSSRAEDSPADRESDVPRSVTHSSNEGAPLSTDENRHSTAVPPPPPRSLPAEKTPVLPRGRVRVSDRYWDWTGELTQPEPVYQPPPEYPEAAKSAGVQGNVVLNVTIAKDGTVQGVKALSGPPLLVTAAVDGVQHWRYLPTVRNGDASEVTAQIYVTFSLAK